MSRYTRRHYEDFADLLADLHLQNAAFTVRKQVVDDLEAACIALFTRDNPRFNAERFRKAARWQPDRLAS
jgi:hypothetical protein